MNNFIKKIIKEASFRVDKELDTKIRNLRTEVYTRVRDYKEDTNDIEYNEEGKNVQVKIPNAWIIFFDKHSKYTNHQDGGEFKPNQELIKIYGCNLDWEPELKKWFNLDLQLNSLYHELVHYFDFQKINLGKFNKPYKDVRTTPKEQEKYHNHGIELNAYFLQYIMPIVKQFLNYNGSAPLGSYTFNNFKEDIFLHDNVKKYFEKLTESNKKRFLKRLAEYFQRITEIINEYHK